METFSSALDRDVLFSMIDIAAYTTQWCCGFLRILDGPSRKHLQGVFLSELGMQPVKSHATSRYSRPLGKRRRINESAMRSSVCEMNYVTSRHTDSDGR